MNKNKRDQWSNKRDQWSNKRNQWSNKRNQWSNKRNQWRQFLFYLFVVTKVILDSLTFAWGVIRLWHFFRKS